MRGLQSSCGMQNLQLQYATVPRPGTESKPPELGAQSLKLLDHQGSAKGASFDVAAKKIAFYIDKAKKNNPGPPVPRLVLFHCPQVAYMRVGKTCTVHTCSFVHSVTQKRFGGTFDVSAQSCTQGYKSKVSYGFVVCLPIRMLKP